VVPTVPNSEIVKKDNSDSIKALKTLAILIAIGLLGTIAFAFQSGNWTKFISFSIIGLMVAGASLLAGGLLGFLFGIPRTLQQTVNLESNQSAPTDNRSGEDKGINYLANTNLEQISDWLTKILVGVGLTQINVIPEKLGLISGLVAKGLSDTDESRVFASAIILFFIISGFLFGYLWTRLFLPNAFKQADLSVLENRVEKATQQVKQVNKKLEELERQSELDASALSLAQRQLNPSTDVPAATQEQLNQAIKNASKPIKIQIFNQAQLQRANNWQLEKQRMELTIPIFKALIEDDINNEFHKNHGQLGFALKDKQEPDWEAAEIELTKAINIRGNWYENGWLFYEFNRAFCLIKKDSNFQSDQPSDTETRGRILADLKASYAGDDLKDIVMETPIFQKWMKLNKVTARNLNS
jgi:hypothetical protein